MQALADSDFVVEAIKENEVVKKTAFSLLDNVRILLHTIAQALKFLSQHPVSLPIVQV